MTVAVPVDPPLWISWKTTGAAVPEPLTVRVTVALALWALPSEAR